MTEPLDTSAPSKWRTRSLYLVIPTLAVIVLTIAVNVGSDLHSPTGTAVSKTATPTGAINTADVLWRLLIAIAVIVVTARLVGALFRSIGQPQVVGEIVAGIVLGPSVLGALFPTLSEHLFTGQVMPFIEILASIGLILVVITVALVMLGFRLVGRDFMLKRTSA